MKNRGYSHRVRVSQRVMIRTTEMRERAVYTIRNEDISSPRTVIILNIPCVKAGNFLPI